METVLKDRHYHKRNVLWIVRSEGMNLPHGAGCELVLIEEASILDIVKRVGDVISGLNAGGKRAAMEILQDTGCRWLGQIDIKRLASALFHTWPMGTRIDLPSQPSDLI